MNAVKYIFVLLFIVVYCLFGLELGYTATSMFYTHITYMFQHLSIIHLAINSIAFIVMFHNLQKLLNIWIIIASIFVCGFAASFLSMYDIPTVGASSMIYAMVGIDIGMTLLCKEIKIANTRRYLLFICGLALCLLISAFIHNSNFLIHIYSLIFGFIVSVVFSIHKTR
ncbi:rhomboid family intramembrane serine protease [Dysgonomonas sp. 216]|uniref:rhomboid family intramembrane serine protease n=1 Tax=Dysgonomonas sp. 216 TaxID=2302934 RepID=UPI0013D64F00|nr:rhomboid family intramembrane serine protease [Dysgonomonas sp. 216]NDW19414.1 rhomboid family intramembrane serine protease [Dysgonomonas sp. 216]